MKKISNIILLYLIAFCGYNNSYCMKKQYAEIKDYSFLVPAAKNEIRKWSDNSSFANFKSQVDVCKWSKGEILKLVVAYSTKDTAEKVKYLLEKVGWPSNPHNFKITAMKRGLPSVFGLLVERFGTKNLILPVIENGNEEYLKILIEKGFYVNANCSTGGRLPLKIAAEEKQFEMVKLLFNSGAMTFEGRKTSFSLIPSSDDIAKKTKNDKDFDNLMILFEKVVQKNTESLLKMESVKEYCKNNELGIDQSLAKKALLKHFLGGKFFLEMVADLNNEFLMKKLKEALQT